MKYNLFLTSAFKKDYKKITKQGFANLVDEVISKLENDIPLDKKNRDHPLKGDKSGCRECHVRPDLVLVYKKNTERLILACLRVGSHSEVLGM